MRKVFFALCLSGLLMQPSSGATPDFQLIGFASLNGGTTGGEGGETVTVDNFADLKKYAEDPATPYVIRIDGEINTGITAYIEEGTGKITSESANAIRTTYGEIIRMGSNKTLIGMDSNALLNRIGIVVQCQSNIIIRNIKFTFQDVPIDKSGENKVVGFRNGAEQLLGDPDCICIQADDENLPASERKSRNIWIDHCEFYNYPKASEHKDRYDGLLDIKNDVQYVTVSWCHFHDHSKACLFGKGNSDAFDRTTTLHHNYFENIKGSRLPLLRYGRHHYFNNYMKGCEDGMNLRKESNAYIEGCYFEDTKTPVFGKSSENGRGTLRGNIFKNCQNLPEGCVNVDQAKQSTLKESVSFAETDFVPADCYDYTAVTDAAEDVPAIVAAYAGTGKIDDTTVHIATPAVSKSMLSVRAEGRTIIVQAGMNAEIKVFGSNGKLLYARTASDGTTAIPLPARGVYIVQATTADRPAECRKVVL